MIQSRQEGVINFHDGVMPYLAATLLDTDPVHIGEWQSKDTSAVPHMATYEAMDMQIRIDVPETDVDLALMLGEDLNLPWAEQHFAERVSGRPFNPPPSHKNWPWAKYNGNHQTGDEQQFSHTYPERMWPKQANLSCPSPEECRDTCSTTDRYTNRRGIRFHYGDLQDVVNLLHRSPLTRQAYLPIWFPEDTGAHHRQRVPCTIGYHFMIRDSQLSCRYYMRSCDLIRHFTDDLYMAARLMQWITDQLNMCPNSWHDSAPARKVLVCPECKPSVKTGRLIMYISSLHAFTGDAYKLKQIKDRANVDR